MLKILIRTITRCLEITEKVSFSIATEANYIYILSEQKFIKSGQPVLPDRSILMGNAKIDKLKCDNLSDFQTM